MFIGVGAESADDTTDSIRTELRKMKTSELREELGSRGISWGNFIEKEELVKALAEAKMDEAGFCASGLVKPGQVAELSGAEIEVEIQDSSSPLLLDVYARWCGPCQLMAPELKKAAQVIGTKARVVKLDSDQDPDLASRLHVGGLPTIILFEHGKEIKRLEGAVMANQLLAFVESHGTKGEAAYT
eukprot:CAMPEP_0197330630 /NCGR_PEP_ID=MMETSP0892-20130614/6950_1 /TAXON_ID=44058 ORGANISM="Aureoumbra lagunensis, Strain CCMP1510" /NCGR_SAMPLE_ID=MMETSP0892 /ASSEMBLY_ACC=CAM_ASM_000538 /LENGTH=185 /DNA_ID=CAMNT_0042827911 /DNA_START=127 /DNA_END=684 /DNA_ORIENTATION=+